MDPYAQPRSLLIKPASGDCNLHCEYCFYHERESDPYKQRKKRRMSPEVLDALIRQGMALHPRQATFGWQGGEPTMAGLPFFQKVVELQKKYGRRGQAVSNGLQTNSILLTRDWAPLLRDYHFLLGVSLDGPAEYHDHFRYYANGAPSHSQVMERLAMLGEERVEFNILSVVNSLTGDHGAEIYDYLLDQEFRFLQFIPCVEVDPHSGEITDFSVSPEQYGDFMCAVFDRWYNGGNPEASVRDFEAILAVYVGQQAPLCSYQREGGNYVVVEYNGDVYPCDFLVRQDLHLGNIMETPLTELFASEGLQRFGKAKAIARPECQACAWLPLCNQGCPRFVGIGGQKRHYLCRSYQQFFAHAHRGFLDLRDQVLRQMGRDPASVPLPVDPPMGRNDPCPCGSGKKFKQCCGRTSRGR